ncbi:hypothetical protein AHiyo4_06210 [Arthrobacter sp. Hiyo4]|nr:hypothetical protein AHiyo4_06210 [Arthrobacter sp. Hiyo4]
MDMYTDWGNLKVVSCGAWLEGRTRQLNGVSEEWAHWGVHFYVNGPARARIAACGNSPPAQLGDAGMFR